MDKVISTKHFSSIVESLKKKLPRYHEKPECFHFLRIICNVLEKLDPQKVKHFFFNYYFVFKAIVDLNYIELQLLINLYLNGQDPVSFDWFKINKGFAMESKISRIVRLLIEKGLVDMIRSENVDLIDILKLLTLDQLNLLRVKYCIMVNEISKEEICRQIVNIAKHPTSTNNSIELEIKNEGFEMVSGMYKFNCDVYKLISSIFTFHYPDLMDVRNIFMMQPPFSMKNILIKALVKGTGEGFSFEDNSLVSIISIYDSMEDMLEYIEASDVLKEIMLVTDINSQIFAKCLKYAQIGFMESSSKLVKWINKGLPTKLLKYTKIALLLQIYNVAAEKFFNAKKFTIVEELYKYITEEKNFINFIEKIDYSNLWVKRYCNIITLNDDTLKWQFFKGVNKFKMFIKEFIFNEIYNVHLNMSLEKKSEAYICDTDEAVLPISKNYQNNNNEYEYVYNKCGILHPTTLKDAVLEYFKGYGEYTHGGYYKNIIWKEILYLIYGDLILGKPFQAAPFCHEFIEDHPLIGSMEFIEINKIVLENRFNVFMSNKKGDILDVIGKNMEIYWKIKNVNENTAIFKNPMDFLNFISCLNIQGLLFLCNLQMGEEKVLFSDFPDIVLWNVETKKMACYNIQEPGKELSYSRQHAVKSIKLFLQVSSKCVFVKL